MRADVRGEVGDDLRAVGQKLRIAAGAERAIGLAGAHIGEIAPVVIVSGEPSGGTLRVLYNPRIVAISPILEKGEEGSVSLPGVRVAVERPDWADIAFMDEAGNPIRERFAGFAARVALHEIDQMNGVFFLERVSRLKREMALKKATKLGG